MCEPQRPRVASECRFWEKCRKALRTRMPEEMTKNMSCKRSPFGKEGTIQRRLARYRDTENDWHGREIIRNMWHDTEIQRTIGMAEKIGIIRLKLE